MPDDNEEQFEEYLELEQFLAELRAGRVAHLPSALTPRQARIYRMALLFHAATSGASELRPDFAAFLWSQLASELARQQEQRMQDRHVLPRLFSFWRLSRRQLLAGSAVAAASAAVVAGIEQLAEGTQHKETQHKEANDTIPITDSLLEWSLVTTVAKLGTQAVQFVSKNLTGYVVRRDSTLGDQASTSEEILALSGACPHMGCLVTWSGTDRTFRCPCHPAVFLTDGRIKKASSWSNLPPLARLEVKIEAEKIYVRIPDDGS